MNLAKFVFVGLCVFLCISLTSANTNGASSRSINGDGDDVDRFPKMSFPNTHKASPKSMNGDGDDDDGFTKMTFANANRDSSNSVNGDQKMMPGAKHPSSGSAHLRGKGFGFGFGFDSSMAGACHSPNRPVTVEYPCPAYSSICYPSPCYPNPPSYSCQPAQPYSQPQSQTNMAQQVNMKNGAQNSPNH